MDQSHPLSENILPEPIEAYIEQISHLMGLPIHPEHQPGVVENLKQLQRVAQIFLDYPLPEDIEAAARFQP
ncbi:MAG: hypothetical protein RLZZ597_2582 [Cyanobacteriota bacterium]|jgi:hypothetical protein